MKFFLYTVHRPSTNGKFNGSSFLNSLPLDVIDNVLSIQYGPYYMVDIVRNKVFNLSNLLYLKNIILFRLSLKSFLPVATTLKKWLVTDSHS